MEGAPRRVQRVCLFASSYLPEVNGGSANLHQRLQLLSSWGYKVLLIAPNYSILDAYTDEDEAKWRGEVLPNVIVHSFPSRDVFVKFSASPLSFSHHKIEKIVQDFKPDIIQIESPERLFWGFLWPAGYGIKGLEKVPIVGVHHTDYPGTMEIWKNKFVFFRTPGFIPWFRGLYRFVYGHHTLNIVNSEYSTGYMRRYGIDNLTKCEFLGINADMFHPSVSTAEAVEMADLAGATKLLYVGRLDDDKCIPDLMAAFDLAEQQLGVGALALVFVGAGQQDFEDGIVQWAKGRPYIRLAGKKDNNTTPHYYSACDVFITPSPIETTGLTVMEAMACGKATIGPDRGGTANTISHMKTGVLYRARDPQHLAESIVLLAKDPALRQSLGAAGRDFIVKEHSISAGTRKMTLLWEALYSPNPAAQISLMEKPNPVHPLLRTSSCWAYVSVLAALLRFRLIPVHVGWPLILLALWKALHPRSFDHCFFVTTGLLLKGFFDVVWNAVTALGIRRKD